MAKKNKSQQTSKQPQSDVVAEDESDLQAKIEELTVALQRERADAVNLRRRHEEELSSLSTRLKSAVITDLLPVIDNFERSTSHVPDDLKSNDFVKGVQGIIKQFEKTLSDMGVERIKTVGEEFDPNLHEAVSMEEGDSDRETITEELQAGYRIGDDVIRHAMVRVKS